MQRGRWRWVMSRDIGFCKGRHRQGPHGVLWSRRGVLSMKRKMSAQYTLPSDCFQTAQSMGMFTEGLPPRCFALPALRP